jgi:hypothetical protein
MILLEFEYIYIYSRSVVFTYILHVDFSTLLFSFRKALTGRNKCAVRP